MYKLLEWHTRPFIRKLARRNDWQLRYGISLELKQPLFEGEVSSFDTNKLRFVYWLNFYHNIYIKPDKERPKESIIENDTLLDEHMRIKIAKEKHPPKFRRSNKASQGKGGEVINFE